MCRYIAIVEPVAAEPVKQSIPRRRERTSVSSVSIATIEREATRLFGERTYPVVGMRDIGDAVGLLPGSLYVHISSKDALLRRIVERGIQNFLDVIEPIARDSAPASDRIRRALQAFVETLDATHAQARIAFYQWTYLSGEDHDHVVDMRRRYEQLFVDMVKQGIAAGEFRPTTHVRVAVHMMLGTIHSLCHWYSPGGELSVDEVARTLVDVVLNGLQGSGAPLAGNSGRAKQARIGDDTAPAAVPSRPAGKTVAGKTPAAPKTIAKESASPAASTRASRARSSRG